MPTPGLDSRVSLCEQVAELRQKTQSSRVVAGILAGSSTWVQKPLVIMMVALEWQGDRTKSQGMRGCDLGSVAAYRGL